MSKPRPVLSQMPWNVKQLIVDSGDTETKIALRPVSKEFKGLVNRSKISYKQLSFELKADKRTAEITFVPYLGQTMQLEFIHNENGYKVKKLGIMGILVTEGNFIEAAVNQFVKVVRNPKVLVESCEMHFYENVYFEFSDYTKNEVLERLHPFLSSLPTPVCIERFWFKCLNQTDILKVLPYIKPRTLKRLHLVRPWTREDYEVDLSEVAETDQWKLAEVLMLKGYSMTLPIEKWSHFKIVHVEIHKLTVIKLQVVYNSFLNSRQWHYCKLSSKRLNVQPFVEYFSQLGSHTTNGKVHSFSITIPNSEKPLMVSIKNSCIYLYKDRGF